MTDPTEFTRREMRLFYPADPAEGETLPYSVSNRAGGVVVIELHAGAIGNAALGAPASYKWINGFRGKVVIDLSHLALINSALCNWMVNLMRAAKPAAVSVTGANARVIETLRLLRLDTIVSIEG